MAERNGVGLFARMLTERFPLLPVEEEDRLNDMPPREDFISSCELDLGTASTRHRAFPQDPTISHLMADRI